MGRIHCSSGARGKVENVAPATMPSRQCLSQCRTRTAERGRTTRLSLLLTYVMNGGGLASPFDHGANEKVPLIVIAVPAQERYHIPRRGRSTVKRALAFAAMALILRTNPIQADGDTTNSTGDGWLGVRADVVFGSSTVIINDFLHEQPFKCTVQHKVLTRGGFCQASASAAGLKEIAVKCLDECLLSYSGGRRLEQCKHNGTVVETSIKTAGCDEKHQKKKTIWQFPDTLSEIDLKKVLCDKARTRVPADQQKAFALKNLELWGRRDHKGDQKDHRRILFYDKHDCGNAAEAKPDLMIESLALNPASPTTKSEITFTLVVKNTGAAKASPSKASLRIGAGGASSYDVPELAPGKSHSIVRKIKLDNPLNYSAEAKLDTESVVTEVSENNNEKTLRFTVTKATN